MRKRKAEKDKARIFDEMPNSRKKAQEIAETFVHVKPTKFLTKK